MSVFNPKVALPALFSLALLGCAKEGDLTVGGIIATRSACPTVAIPAPTGDITLFNPESSRDASAIDVVASTTNVQSTCNETGEYIVTNVTFDVNAQRRDPSGARNVVLPYFAVVIQGSDNVVSKSVSRVSLDFAEGQYRASSTGAATGQVLRAAATLPQDIQRELTREREPGDVDAVLDPMANPKVRAAVQRASFELLVGFQLTEEQLRYNATR